ncbi:M24 family metallopeptidase [Fusibacter ferrireducens]|uniref:Aminopeptidase P family protein n=1 Tax=Fusibacter ferrireducens TaxID=2785058 RepID=A0ABR9ZWK5_9FIRM|nr:Xaa-Pro peptidase family protein [Fusibacter ferrireducens]MBF4694840.1 aminopeptidase P family protein [Fusibacter ferrireducens]
MYNKRLEKIRSNMKQNQIDAMIVTATDSIYYLLGVEIHPGERLMALLIKEHSAVFFLNALFPLKETLPVVVRYYKDTDKPIEMMSKEIGDHVTVGVDKEWPSRFLLELMGFKASCTFVNGSVTVDSARLIKSKEEGMLMRNASKLNDEVMRLVYEYIQENVGTMTITESMIQEKVKAFNAELGVHELSFTPLICFGENGAEPHHDSDETVLRENQAIIVDIGGRKDGYCSDMTRSFYYGTPPEEYVKVYELVRKANLAGIQAVRPGVAFKEIDAAARNVIAEAGYGDFFTHRTGHGIGINVHEFPDVSAVNEMICELGMTFSIEPGIYLTNQFGVRIEDLVRVTETGCEVLNQYPKDLLTIISPN